MESVLLYRVDAGSVLWQPDRNILIRGYYLQVSSYGYGADQALIAHLRIGDDDSPIASGINGRVFACTILSVEWDTDAGFAVSSAHAAMSGLEIPIWAQEGITLVGTTAVGGAGTDRYLAVIYFD